MYTYTLYPVETGFGYHILNDDSVIISQDYAPDLSGFVVMSESQAIQSAQEVIVRLKGV